MSKTYKVTIEVTGYITFHTTADNPEEAREKAEDYANDQDFGPLRDIDYDIGQPKEAIV